MFVNESAMQGKVNTPSSQQNRSGNVSYPSRTIIHPKLELTEPGDSDEQEADAAASEVMSGKVCRKISGGGAGGGMAVSSKMESQLNHLQGGGQTMPSGLRGMMERGFDRDFSQVRLHTDSEAAGLSSSIHAKAFTHGNDIYFNRGQFSPETSEGQRLVAHELAHVAQGGGKVGRRLKTDESYEVEINGALLYNSVLPLAIKMLESALSVIDQTPKAVGKYFWGAKFSSRIVKKNYNKILTELHNQMSDHLSFGEEPRTSKTEIYGLNHSHKINSEDIGGFCSGDEIWIKNIDGDILKNVGKKNEVAESIIHEFSHAKSVFNANDNAYFDFFLFGKQKGWDPKKKKRLKTQNSDMNTADSYSTFAYISYYAPYLLTNEDFWKSKTFKDLAFDKRVGIMFDANGADGNAIERTKTLYNRVFSNKEEKDDDSLDFVDENESFKWSEKKKLILNASDIAAIEAIPGIHDYSNENLVKFIDGKYWLYMNLLMKNQLGDRYRILYWLFLKQNGEMDSGKRAFLKSMAEKELKLSRKGE